MKITICGSATFVKKMSEVADFLRSNGHTVFTPEPLISEDDYIAENGRSKLLADKPFFTKRHFSKIENSDAVLITNYTKKGIDGYFGSNTLMELSVAFHLDEKIYLLNAIKDDHPHYEEIIGINSVILDGDLNKIV